MQRTGWFVALAAAALMLTATGTAKAQSLDTRDRAFLFYNYYANQMNTERVMRQQQQFERQFNQFRQADSLRFNQQSNLVERYVQEGRETVPQGVGIPRIYSGAGPTPRQQYFMRNSQFNPAR